ncbi:MAG TPA: hypothetical protein VH437_15685 [Terriglobales bacterium]
MRIPWLVPIVVLLCVVPGCSPRDFLTRRLASDLIAGSDAFKNPQHFWLRTGVIPSKDYSSPEYLVLQRQGWITGVAAPCPPSGPGTTRQPGPPGCWDVSLTPLGVDAFRDLIPKNVVPMQYFNVPIAKRELIEVTGISKAGNFADVEFQWKWIPVNEVGTALNSGGVVYNSVVGFREYDDGWRVVRANAKSNQDLEEALVNTDPPQ